MVRVSFQNHKSCFGISSKQPVYACDSQLSEIFEGLPSDDGSFMIIINDQDIKVRISGYNTYVWKIDIPDIKKQGAYQIFLPKEKCLDYIKQIFNGVSPFAINGLSFEKFR